MSTEAFVKYGHHYGLIRVKDGGQYGPIELYDIGEEGLVGAVYTDKSRQAQPAVWYHGMRQALAEHAERRERPRLSRQVPRQEPADVPAQRPRLQKRAATPGVQPLTPPKERPPRKMSPQQRVEAAARNHAAINPLDNVAAAELRAARPYLKKRHG